jgi:hypothetical protein
MVVERIWAFLWIIILLALILYEYRRSKEFVSPWILFLTLSIFDIYLPVALFQDAGFSQMPPWISPRIQNTTIHALVFYSFGVVIYGLGYILVQKRNADSKNAIPAAQITDKYFINTKRVLVVLIISGLWYVILLGSAWGKSGSAFNWLLDKLLNRFQGTAVIYSNPFEQLFYQMGEQMRVVMIFCIYVLYASRFSGGSRFVRSWMLPFFGVLVSTLTFFRGTQIAYFLGLVIIETLATKNTRFQSKMMEKNKKGNWTKRAISLGIMAVLFFIAYGSLRNSLIQRFRSFGYTEKASLKYGLQVELRRVVTGEGLRSLAAIINFYPQGADFLYGKTLLDMTLLPIPRFIWEDKPLWYGIDDITRGMGWPASTQNAVTMPGEFYANFGYPGILLMMFYGLIFGAFNRYRLNTRWMFAFAVWMPTTVMTTFWMAYTGFMNSLIRLPFLLIITWFCIPKLQINSTFTEEQRLHGEVFPTSVEGS